MTDHRQAELKQTTRPTQSPVCNLTRQHSYQECSRTRFQIRLTGSFRCHHYFQPGRPGFGGAAPQDPRPAGGAARVSKRFQCGLSRRACEKRQESHLPAQSHPSPEDLCHSAFVLHGQGSSRWCRALRRVRRTAHARTRASEMKPHVSHGSCSHIVATCCARVMQPHATQGHAAKCGQWPTLPGFRVSVGMLLAHHLWMRLRAQGKARAGSRTRCYLGR